MLHLIRRVYCLADFLLIAQFVHPPPEDFYEFRIRRYMQFEEFKKIVADYMRTQIEPDCNVSTQSFPKNNGIVLDGLVITHPERNISPTIYLNPYYGRYLDGVSMEDICKDIKETYFSHMPETDFDVTQIESFENAKDKIIMKLINFEENEKRLDTLPYMRFLDMAIIFQYSVELENIGHGTITINNALFRKWDIPLEQIYEVALQNTPLLFPFLLKDILEYLPAFSSQETYSEEGMYQRVYVLTNSRKINGATVILYQNLLEQLGKDLILIPSSIHEVLLIPTDDVNGENLDYYNHMIQEVNETVLTDEEVLSSHVYCFSRKTSCLY